MARSFMLLCFLTALLMVVVPRLPDGDRQKTANVEQEKEENPQPNTPFRLTSVLPLPSAPLSQPRTKIIVDLSDRRVYFYRGDRLETSYPVAIGQPGWETPVGSYRILQKIEHPTWQQPITGEDIPPGENNPLGDRWIGFWRNEQAAIGFHGTADESQMGQAVSHGCVRMRNRDIRQLYDRADLGTRVIVRP